MNCRRLFSGLCAPGMALVCLICGGTLRAEGAQPPDSAPPRQQSGDDTGPTKPQSQAAEGPKAPPDGRTMKEEPDPAVPSLEEMLSVALQHNPNVRRAQAQLQVAEAELDHTRLEVAQKLVGFRDRWQSQRAAILVAQDQLRDAQRLHQLIQTGTARAPDPLPAAQERLALERQKLAELQSELPFLLGKPLPAQNAAADPTAASGKADLLRDTLRPLLKKLIDASTANFRAGRGTMEQIYEPSLRLMKVERELASTEAERIAAIETHRDRMKQLRDEAEALSKAGVAGQDVLLATQVYVAEADLALIEERAND